MLLDRGVPIQGERGYDYQFMYDAVKAKNIEIAELLLQHGAKRDQPNIFDGVTPLAIAVMQGDAKMVRFLLDNGADVNAVAGPIDYPHLVTPL